MLFTKLAAKIKNFVRREDGASGIEYVIVAAMVAVVLVGFMPSTSTAVKTIFTKIDSAMTTAAQ